VLAKEMAAVQKALSNEQSARSAIDHALAEERAARQAAEQALQHSKDANATLALKLENAQTSLVATRDKLERKSTALDFQVIRADEAALRLENIEGRLKAVEEDLMTQGNCWNRLSKLCLNVKTPSI
jgi:chromosome segregation ATPase